jgi:hypothetical protein
MNSKIFYLFFLLISNIIYSQPVKKFLLLNSKDSTRVPYATIKILNTDIGTFTNEVGEFELMKTSDTALITSIGFSEKKIVLSSLSADIIFIEPQFYQLSEVIIKKKELTGIETLGIQKAKEDFLWGPSGSGEEFAQRINILSPPGEIVKIKKISLPAKNFDVGFPVVLHIYSENETTHLPDKELLQQNYIITKKDFHGKKIVVNLENEKIWISEKYIFISFQWLSSPSFNSATRASGTLLYMTNSLMEEQTYSRRLSSKKYEWIPAPKIRDKIKPSNTMFSVEIERYR